MPWLYPGKPFKNTEATALKPLRHDKQLKLQFTSPNRRHEIIDVLNAAGKNNATTAHSYSVKLQSTVSAM